MYCYKGWQNPPWRYVESSRTHTKTLKTVSFSIHYFFFESSKCWSSDFSLHLWLAVNCSWCLLPICLSSDSLWNLPSWAASTQRKVGWLELELKQHRVTAPKRDNIKMDFRINNLWGNERNSASTHRYTVVNVVVYLTTLWFQNDRNEHIVWLNDY